MYVCSMCGISKLSSSNNNINESNISNNLENKNFNGKKTTNMLFIKYRIVSGSKTINANGKMIKKRICEIKNIFNTENEDGYFSDINFDINKLNNINDPNEISISSTDIYESNVDKYSRSTNIEHKKYLMKK